MGGRFFLLLAFQLSGLLLGWYALGPWGATGGALLAALLWLALDSVAANRLLRWLKLGAAGDAADLRGGPWGEAGERMRKLLRLSEQERRASDACLQDFLAAIQASPNGVVLLDAHGRIEWCNQTAAQHMGFDAQRDAMQLIGNLVREPSFTAYLAGGDYASDLVIPGRDHSESRPVRIALQLHAYGEGRRLLLSRDVTSVEQAEAMRRDFVANVSHEIRTPLTVLSGFVETLQSLALDERERSRYLTLMAQQSSRMQTLVDDLLTLSRLEGSPSPSLDHWIALGPLLARCEADARSLVTMSVLDDAPSHQLHFEFDGNLIQSARLDGSSDELLSAFSNLISNAIRYTPAGGRVDVAWIEQESGEAIFEVRDNGPGIAAEHLPRLTERFYRVDQSRSRQTGGTGLGLAIVKHVVQRHGAHLLVESTPGKGSRFAVQFPAARYRRHASA